MAKTEDLVLARAIADSAVPLIGAPEDFGPLLELVGDARCVLIGEATHGTHEFYRLRAQLTKSLIVLKGFVAVAAEADWPDAYRVNRYVRGLTRDAGAADAPGALREPRLQRAIGVLYRPETERVSHYFRTAMPDQFDALIHVDRSRALEPLERTAEWEKGEAPETFPTGM